MASSRWVRANPGIPLTSTARGARSRFRHFRCHRQRSPMPNTTALSAPPDTAPSLSRGLEFRLSSAVVRSCLLAEQSPEPAVVAQGRWRPLGSAGRSGSSITGREDHPVVHIAWYDALAYCTWSGLQLPSEAQWQRAAQGGLVKRKFPWGDELTPGGQFVMNTFQGSFPSLNTAEDGWIGTAPVDACCPDGYGMYSMTGNVWEWVADRFGPLPASARIPPTDPTGATIGHARVQRGGSYLCHDSYCDRYHVHSRTRNDPDSSTGKLRVQGRGIKLGRC